MFARKSEEEYKLCKIIGDPTNTKFVVVGHFTSFNPHIWDGKDVVTGIPIFYRRCYGTIDAAKLGLQKHRLVSDLGNSITKAEALEKIKELYENQEKAISYIQAIKSVRPRYVATLKEYRKKIKEENSEKRKNDKQLTKNIKMLTRKMRTVNK